MNVREYLFQKNFNFREVSRNGHSEAVMNCPFCDDKEKKFAINLDTGVFNCKHENNCNAKGNFFEFQKRLGDSPVRQTSYEHFNPQNKVYKEPKLRVRTMSQPILDYLHNRGFTDETIKHFQISESNDGMIVFPYIKNGKLVNAKYRSITDKHVMRMEKDAEPCLFNHDNAGEELIITEGCYDAMALYQYGHNACSVPNGASGFSWIETEYEWMDKFSQIFLCFDNDVAGKRGCEIAIQRLGAWRCKVVTFPEKDANDCLIKGISKQEIDECFEGAVDVPPIMLTSPIEYAQDILDMFHNPAKYDGVPTFLSNLTEILRGWREGELTIWTGNNSSGKSTILNQCMLDLAKNNIGTCVASLEMLPRRYLKWAIQQHIGKEEYSDNNILKTLSWMNGRIFICNRADVIEPKELLNVFEYTAKKYGAKHFLIDSLSRIKLSNKDVYEAQQDFINQLLNFAKQYLCHVHLVAHPRKGEKDSDEPGKVDIKGSGYIQDMADNIICMHRYRSEDVSEKGDCTITVLKNREHGFFGKVFLKFDPVTKLFVADEERNKWKK